ncbi:E3 ubiquitin-protein ligase TRIM63-like [Haliotis rufescens]|uniref:E3 ubiquitin-protein ligase TRIM63-like n=1 Tax=Haliotis rufescens TaxID=6454 RepID=UPI00201E8BF1|nr:E3 ubiquitin-protein ligase TRIM63-like [Haliotis rufescens]
MSCPICLDPFKDPVVLPCGHSFCRTTCTKGLVRRGRIACPTCRKVHLAPGGVKGLPKNYALEEVIEEKPISDPLCPDHLDERVNLFCTQCYVPVCVKCCLCRRVRGHSAGHWEHQVIPLDQMKAYIQGLLSVAEGYLASRRREECNYLEKLMAAEERIQVRRKSLRLQTTPTDV